MCVALPPPQALVSCLELLEEESVETRVCGCKALACLKVGLNTPPPLVKHTGTHHLP